MAFMVSGRSGHRVHNYQRFVPFSEVESESKTEASSPSVPEWAALALDTKTGSLCLTYRLNANIDHSELKSLPTCMDLYDKDHE
jgi:hypothetical protein